MPFRFSLLPRRRLEYGSAKHVSMPSPSRRRVWRANPVPLSCVTPPRAPAGSGENIASCAPDAFPGGLAGHDPGHEEPGLPLDLGVQVASGADHAVGLPMAETAAVSGLRRTLGDGNPSGNRETRRPPAATPATPPVAAWKAARPAFTAMAVGADPTVDGLRAHAHGGVVGEQDAQPAADGQRRPAATQPFGHPRPQAFA